jgi:hypothetical protein
LTVERLYRPDNRILKHSGFAERAHGEKFGNTRHFRQAAGVSNYQPDHHIKCARNHIEQRGLATVRTDDQQFHTQIINETLFKACKPPKLQTLLTLPADPVTKHIDV